MQSACVSKQHRECRRWQRNITAWRRVARPLFLAVAIVVVHPTHGFAQLNGQNIKGDGGLKSGSQAPPGTYVAVPLYFYTADQIKDRNGNELRTGSLDAAVFGIALNIVTTKRLAGATYGFLVVLPWANNRVQGVNDFDSNPGAGLTDMFVQPINLGWHKPRADAMVAYGLYLPTGRYDDGADNNTGLGMWAQELLFGTTVYLNETKRLHAASTATIDFQSEKENSSTKVGNILNLEGGVGADFLGGGLTAGLTYYGTYKLSDDRFDSRTWSFAERTRCGDSVPKSPSLSQLARRSMGSQLCGTSGNWPAERPPRAQPGISRSCSR